MCTPAEPSAEVRQALDTSEFVLHYQPIVDLTDGRVSGVEALIRWQHPVGGLLMPDDFIPGLVQTPLMASITQWVLRSACAAAARWPDWTISVNITARDLASDCFGDTVQQALTDAGVACDRLVLEITETALVQDLPRAAKTLRDLRDCGVGVALDDFGTGYSSMLYLRALPVTTVKIDRLFVSGVRRHSEDLAIVESLLTLAREVRLTAVAEGVETEAQSRLLRSLGCPLAQGYLWSRPLTEEAIDDIYRNGLRGAAGARRRKRSRGHTLDAHVAERAHQLLSAGASLHTIAAALNAEGERTGDGGRWHAATVAKLIHDTADTPGRKRRS